MEHWRIVRGNVGWALVNSTTREEIHIPYSSYEFVENLAGLVNAGAFVTHDCVKCYKEAILCEECALKARLNNVGAGDESLHYLLVTASDVEYDY